MLSRRAALQGGSAAMAIAAPLAVIPPRTKAEDGEVLGIAEEWRRELELEWPALTHWDEAISALMPPGLRETLDALRLAEGRAALFEIVKRPEIVALNAEYDRRQEARRGLGNRLVETPATTLSGINAKLQVSMKAGRNTAIARSAADDLERLVREG